MESTKPQTDTKRIPIETLINYNKKHDELLLSQIKIHSKNPKRDANIES